MIDKYNRTIDYMRLSVTDRCNLRCKYCMPESGVSKKLHREILRHEELVEIVKAGAQVGIKKIRLTGGEPLIRKNIVELVKEISNVEGINEVTMTTNGLLLKNYLNDLKEAGLTRINLSLDTLKSDRYKSITRGGNIEDVLSCIPLILAAGLSPLKINVVLIGGFNEDEISDFVELTRHQNIEVRFIELMPIGEASRWTNDKFVSNQKVLEVVELIKIDKTHPSSPAEYYKLKDGVGKVGLINPISCSFCVDCNRIRVTSDGKVKPCLHSDQEIELMKALRNHEDIVKILRVAITSKPKEHLINDKEYKPITRDMNRIGG
ncbi:MAG: GTP 3',8-cyclase MoaA [Clostridiales bacterium]|nr:GTP 3',8-cyclase MoaA [Clostridiales bacterium]